VKRTIKHTGIIVLAAVIVFSMAACNKINEAKAAIEALEQIAKALESGKDNSEADGGTSAGTAVTAGAETDSKGGAQTVAASSGGQSVLFAAKKGMVLTYRNLDAQGRTTGYSVISIKDVKGSGKNMTITYGMEMQDGNRKTLNIFPADQTFTVEVKNDVAYLDMNQFIPAEMRQQGIKIEVSGIPMELPSNLKAGQNIKDANITMTMDLGVMKMDTVMNMINGKCLAIEDVNVPAGTFKSHKITQTFTTAVMGTSVSSKSVSWYAPGIGTVKTETYDDKDKLTSSSVLIEKKG